MRGSHKAKWAYLSIVKMGRKMKKLYLCCYDIQDDKVRARVYLTIKKYVSGGQYSAYECYLTSRQKQHLDKGLQAILEECDTLHFQPLQASMPTICLGRANQPADPVFLYLG